jgi:phosphate transport system permease protein
VSALTTPPDLNPLRTARERRRRLNLSDLRGNRTLRILALGGGAVVLVALVAVVVQVVVGANLAFSKFGIGFIGHTDWLPNVNKFGGLDYILGSLVTALVGTVGGAVIGVSIGLFLALIAPRRVAIVIGPLVEMLAAVPSVVLGLIGIKLIAPFVRSDMEPWLHSAFGWTGLFGTPEPVGNSLFCAALVLVIMTVPIIAALTRDTFLTVPQDLRDGAEALGATRWEMIRGVVLPTTKSGVIAACVLGFARAIEEAIAVSQVVGGVVAFHLNLFQGGDTIGAAIADQYGGSPTPLNTSALYYLAVVLLVIGVITNLLARRLVLGGGRRRRSA